MKLKRECKKCASNLTGCRIIKKYGDKVRVSCPCCAAENLIYPEDIIIEDKKKKKKGGEKSGEDKGRSES